MSYPGDPNLDSQIQERVLGTLDQTAQLAADGKVQEARLGCDFMLRLDPLFTPALILQQRLEDANGPIEVGDLTASGTAPPSDPEVLKTVRLSKEELEKLMSEGSQAPAPEAVVGNAAGEELPEVPSDSEPLTPVSGGDRSEPSSIGSGSDGSDKIETLLGEGQAAFDDERYQEAIDSWSRIFLIDIDHEEATRRIDLARQLKEERDRQVEEIFYQAVGFAEDGRTDDAIEAFNRVLRIQPTHVAAREQLDGLQSGSGTASGEAGDPRSESSGAIERESAGQPAVAPSAQRGGVADDGDAPRVADPSYRMSARAKAKPINPFFAIGSGVLVLVLIAAWLLFSNWGRLFPNAEEEPTAPAGDRVARITQLYAEGSRDEAIAALQQIGPGERDFLEARRALARWEEEMAAESAESDVPLLTGEEEERHKALISEGRVAYEGREYLESARLFTRASLMAPLSGAEAALLEDSKRQLEPLSQQIDLYHQRQWELVLPNLWRHLGQDPGNRDVLSLLTNSYFNLTVRELRRGDPKAASAHSEEAIRLSPDDEAVTRLHLFVQTYLEYPRDLLYDIFVGELAFRP